ncbi:protein Flattop [Lissotriton helveticus]
MALNFSANQYEGGFKSNKLQNWGLPKRHKERPSAHDGYTLFIANDRGHLLCESMKSKISPWGTYMGTWDMPRRIPPCKVSSASRSAHAANCLKEWIYNSTDLTSACNGLRPEIDGVELCHEACPKSPTEKGPLGSRRCASLSPEKMRYNVEMQPRKENGVVSGKSLKNRASRALIPMDKGTCEISKSSPKVTSDPCRSAPPRVEHGICRTWNQTPEERPTRPISPKKQWDSEAQLTKMMLEACNSATAQKKPENQVPKSGKVDSSRKDKSKELCT